MTDDLITDLVRQFELSVPLVASVECSYEFFSQQLKSMSAEDTPEEHQPYGVPIRVIDTIKGEEMHLLNHDGKCYQMIRKAGENWYTLDTSYIGCYIHSFNREEFK